MVVLGATGLPLPVCWCNTAFPCEAGYTRGLLFPAIGPGSNCLPVPGPTLVPNPAFELPRRTTAPTLLIRLRRVELRPEESVGLHSDTQVLVYGTAAGRSRCDDVQELDVVKLSPEVSKCCTLNVRGFVWFYGRFQLLLQKGASCRRPERKVAFRFKSRIMWPWGVP